ncbi:autotransporter-associated beta strand repeat-containing protein, partial [Sandarakinorhabdus sp.]|uniref:beta strand repeat-containing protein n=1 Tax=Sandarakinorhabdus sp. TaxID=1916663 RepID=UPI003340FFF7
MIQVASANSTIVVATESRGKRLVRRLGLSAAAAMLAGTALVPATAQTYDITLNNAGGLVAVTDFVGAPLNNPSAISNGLLRVTNNVNLSFGGDLDDSLGLLSFEKRGTGTLTLSGNNSFSGLMGLRVFGGTLAAGSTSALSPNNYLLITPSLGGATATVDLAGFNNAITYLQGSAGSVVTNTVGTATLTINTSESRLFDGALQGNVAILKRGTGTQSFANTDPGLAPTNTTGAITLEAGGISVGSDNVLGSGVLTVTGAATLASTNGAGAVFLDNNIVLDANLVVSPSTTTALRLNGDISGAGSLTKSNTASTLRLAGNNSYNGGTTLQGGRVEVGSNTALGSNAVTLGGAVLALLDPAVSVTLGNDFVAGAAALTAEAGNAGSIFGLSGEIAGTRAVVLAASGGAGTVALSGTNGYTGATRIQAGVLGIGSAGAVASTSQIRFENSGTGISILAPGLTIDRQVTGATVVGTTSATINTGGFDAVFSGRLHDANTGAGEFLGLTKAGTGTLTISNAAAAFGTKNIVSGGVAVSAGTLNLTGRLENDVTVNGGSFGGTGVVAAGTTTVNSGGTLSPGDATTGANAIGRLTLNNLTLAGGSSLRFDLGAPSIDTVTPPNDFVVVNGNLNLGGVLNINPLAGFTVGTYRLFTYAGTLSGALGLGTLPGGFNYNIFAGSGFVDLNVLVADYYWDGVGPFGTGSVDGGTGNWTPAGTNWTDASGVSVVPWGNEVNVSRAFFQGTAGTVTLTESRIFEELHFLTDGYVINPEDSGENLSGLSTTINVADGLTATVNVAIDGADGLTKIGGGTLNFGNANSYVGGTSLNAGRININNNDGLGADGLVMAAGTTLGSYVGQVTLANNITIAGGVTFDSDNFLRLNGIVDGSGGFAKTGAGELVLAGANTFTGDVNVNAGAISLLNSAALGNAANVLNLANGINLVVGADIANNITTNTANGIANDGNARTLGGIISGSALITFSGAGNTTLNGANSFNGGSNITAGTVTLGTNTALGSNTVTMANGTTLAAGANLTLANVITLNGGVTFAANQFSTQFDGAIGGTGGLTVTNVGGAPFNGVAILANAGNDFAGGLTIGQNATVSVATNGALGALANSVTINEGLLSATGTFTTARGITLGGTFGQIDVAGGQSVTTDGAIGGSQLRKGGAGSLTLANAASNYNGGTQVLGGSLVLGGPNVLGAGVVQMFGATSLEAAADSNINNNITLEAGSTATISSRGNVFQLDAAIGEAAAGLGFTKTGSGTLVLNGVNTYTGPTAINDGTVVVGNGSALGTGAANFAANTTLRSGAAVALGNLISVAGGVTIDSVGANGLSLTNTISGSGGVTKTGNGQLALSGNNDFTGGFFQNAGFIVVGSNTAFGAVANLVTIDAAAEGFNLANGVDVGNAFSLGGTTRVDVGAVDVATLSGNIGGVTGSINKTGTGRLILSGNNSYEGGTNVAGTLDLNGSTSAGTGAITLNGATLSAGANLTLTNAIVLSGGGTIDTNNNIVQFDGLVSGTGGLSVTTTAGAPFGAPLTLRNASNSFEGGLTISTNAFVSVATDGALGAAAGGVTINGGLLEATGTFTSGRAITLAGPSGQINVTGAETLTLNGQITGSRLVKGDTGTLVIGNFNNNYSGGTLITGGGTLAVADSNVLGNNQVVLQSGTLASVGAGVIRQANSLEIAAAGNFITIADAANTLEWNGAVSGVDNFTKTGAGTLRLNVTNSYSGTIQLVGGEIDLEGSIVGGINAATGTRVTGAGTSAGATVIADGGTLSPGNSPGTVTFGSLLLNNATDLVWDLDVINTVGMTNDLAIVTTDLTLDGRLQVQAGANFNIGVGSYRLFQYGNLLADNGVTLTNGALPLPAGYNLLTPPAGVTYGVTTSTGVGVGPGNVLFNVAYNGTYFFDGNGTPIDGIIQGGPGTWNGALPNFTNSDGLFNLAYANSFTQVVQFGAGAGGTTPGGAVNVEGTRQFGTINFTDTGYVLGGAGDLAIDGNANLNVTAGTARINNAISGTSSLTKGGNGELVLGSANTYVGNTNVNAGALALAVNGATGTGTVNLANTTTLRSLNAMNNGTDIAHTNAVNITGSATFDVNSAVFSQDALISGGNLVKTGAGQLQLTFNNTYDNTDVQTGSFRATQNASLGNGIVTMAGGTTGTWSGGQTVGNAFVLTLGVVQLGVEAGSTTLTNTVDGGATLEKIGAGRLVLANVANGFGGGTNITAGTLAVAAEGSLGGGNIRFSGMGGTLETLSSFTTAKTVTLDAAGTINTNGFTNQFDGAVSGASSLTKTGSGRLILTGSNTGFTGDTNLNVGSLQISNGNAIGNAGRLTTQGGTTFVAGLAPGANTIALSNNITLAGGQTTIDLVGNLLIINPVTGAVSTNGTNLVLDGTITGAGGFTTSSATAGRIVINGNNDFTGNVNLNSAVVVVGNDNALGINNTVNINQAAGIRNNTGGTTRTIGSIIAVNDPNATIGGNGNLVLNGVVSGADTNVFNKVGLGTVTLANAANSIAAQIEVAQGELAVTGTLTNANQLTNVRAGATLSGTGTINGIVEVVNSGVLSAGIGGDGQVGRLTIGTLLLNEQSSLVFDLGDGYVSGGPLNDQIVTTNLRLGGRLTVRESQAVGASFGLGVYNLITYQGTLMTGSNNVFVQSLPGAFTGTVQTLVPGQVNLIVTNPGTFVQYWDGGDGVGNGVISGNNGTWSALGTNWTGQLDNDPLTPEAQLNTNWINGSVAVFTGTAGTVTLAQTFNAQGLQFTTNGYTLTGGLLDNQSTGVGTGMFVSTDASVTATINSQVQGDGLLRKQGQGTLALGGNNINFSGGTIVENGTLQLNVARGAGTGAITLNGNTTLANGGGTLSVANAVITQAAGTVDSGAGSFTLTGVVSGNGSIAKTGTGNLTLSGSNLYIGGTSLTAGSLTVTNNNSIGTGALTTSANTTLFAGLTPGGASVITLNNAVVLNGATTLNLQGIDADITPQGVLSLDGTTLTLTNSVSGSGSLLVTGFGRLNLNGNNSNFTGGTTLNFAAVYAGTDSAFGTGAITLNNGAIANDSGALRSLSNNIVLAAGGTILGPNDLMLSGIISGAGELTKRTTSTLTLSGNNSYEGGTQLAGGTIEVRSSTALGANISTLFVESIGQTTTLRAGAADLSLGNGVFLQTASNLIVDTQALTFGLAGAINGAGGITKVNSGNLILSGANDYQGGTALTAGTITVRDSNTALGQASSRLTATGGTSLVAGTSGLNLANVATLLTGNLTVDSGTGTFELSGVIDGAGGITKVNSGNLILSGANDYQGGTGLTDGTITVRDSNTALGRASSRLTATGGTSLVAGTSGLNLANVATLLTGNLTVDPGASASTLQLSGVIDGVGGITKVNSGNLILSGANDYQGGTGLTDGTITVRD